MSSNWRQPPPAHFADPARAGVVFFEDMGKQAEDGKAPVADYVSDFLSTSDGLALTKAFMTIKDSRLRKRVVDLVEGIAEHQR